MKVNQVCTKTNLCLKQDDGVVEAARFLKKHQLRRAFVVDTSGSPVGILSTSDISSSVVAEGKNPALLKVKDIMNKHIFVVKEDQDLTFASVDLDKAGVPSAAVTQNGKLIGALTREACIDACLDMIQK